MTPDNGMQRISVLIPVGERYSDPEELFAEYGSALASRGVDYELIFILDGSHKKFEAGLERLAARGETFMVISLTRYFGEATALMVGFKHASGDVVLTLPAYLQVMGADIGLLLDALDRSDIAISRREPRKGGWFERVRRRAFHGLLGLVTRVRLHDLGCSVRAMKRDVLEEIRLYGEQQRFLPVLAERQGFRVTEVPVRPSKQPTQPGVYRLRAYTRGLLDIFNVFFLVRFTKKPLRFFGLIGIALFMLGALELAELVFERLVLHHPLADRPALMLASLFIVLGVQIFALGLLGELIIFAQSARTKDYKIERIAHFPDASRTTFQRAAPARPVAV